MTIPPSLLFFFLFPPIFLVSDRSSSSASLFMSLMHWRCMHSTVLVIRCFVIDVISYSLYGTQIKSVSCERERGERDLRLDSRRYTGAQWETNVFFTSDENLSDIFSIYPCICYVGISYSYHFSNSLRNSYWTLCAESFGHEQIVSYGHYFSRFTHFQFVES